LKTLIIHRHAKSSWDDFSLSDFERPLNNRGEADAPDMGRRLKLQGIHIDHIISSPARRAIDTAHLVAAELHYPLSKIEQDQRIYHASVRTLLNVINQIDDKRRTAMIFGHNPGLTELIDYLTGSDIGNLPTSGQGIIDFDLDSWSEVSRSTGTLVHLDFPKNG
jgi:phosphohistidine phosphatase